MADRRHAAIHEAGHAVMLCRFGLECAGCSLGKGEGFAGFPVPARGALSVQVLLNMIAAVFAGFAASVAAGVDEKIAGAAARHDFKHARVLREVLGDHEPEAARLGAAFAFVKGPRNSRAIELVAAELLEVESLDVHEVEFLIKIADGIGSRDELATYRKMSGRAAQAETIDE